VPELRTCLRKWGADAFGHHRSPCHIPHSSKEFGLVAPCWFRTNLCPGANPRFGVRYRNREKDIPEGCMDDKLTVEITLIFKDVGYSDLT